jgi:hypothetical protein
LESTIDQTEVRLIPERIRTSPSPNWDDVRSRIENYLRAWDISGLCLSRELAPAVFESVRNRFLADPGLEAIEVAITESDRLLEARLKEILTGESSARREAVPTNLRLALLWAGLPGKPETPLSFGVHDALKQAQTELQLCQVPRRSMETFPQRMRTSLTRIPSFRLVGGWCLVIILLVLTFVFTH